MKKIYIILSLSLTILSCREPKFLENATYISDDDFQQIQAVAKPVSLKGFNAKIKHLSLSDEDELILIDSLKQVDLFNNNFEMQDQIKLVDDVIAPQDIISTQKSFYLYDFSLNKLFQFGQKEKEPYALSNTIIMEEELRGLTSISKVSDSLVVATSINNIKGKLLMIKIDSTPRVLKYFGSVDKEDAESNYITGMKYRSTCTYDRYTDRIFVASYFTDVMEGYDRQGKMLFRTHGIGGFEPEYEVKRMGSSQILVNTKKTRRAFLSLTTDEKYVYALYDGKPMKDLRKSFSRTIYIFDKKGKPLKKIQLNVKAYGIKADPHRKKLYIYAISNSSAPLLSIDTAIL